MRLIDADLLIADILEARRSETETVPKLVRFIGEQPTVEPTAELSVANGGTLLVKTDWSIAGTPKCVVVTDGERRWIYYYPEDPCAKELTLEPKCGRWIIEDDTERFIARCSLCGKATDSRMIDRFCPNCGAKMEADE